LKSVQSAGCRNVFLVGPKDQLSETGEISGLFSEIIEDPGGGLPAAINLGIRALPINIKYVGWLGDDDLLPRNSLIRSIEVFNRDEKVVATYGSCSYINENGEQLLVNRSGKWATKFMNVLPNLIPQPGSIFTRDAFESVNGVKSTYPLAFDFELFFELKKIGKIEFIPEVQGCFRWHSDSLSVELRKLAVVQSSKIRKAQLPSALGFFSIFWEPILVRITLMLGRLASGRLNRI
jgi:GT2 family glycosyltransferase